MCISIQDMTVNYHVMTYYHVMILITCYQVMIIITCELLHNGVILSHHINANDVLSHDDSDNMILHNVISLC